MSEAGTLAQHVDYRRLAVQTGRVTGVVSLWQLPRVAAEMQRAPDDEQKNSRKDSNTVDVDLIFREDAQRRVRVEGRIDATLTLCCQRCLSVYDQPVTAQVAGVIVRDDTAAAGVPHDDEPIEAQGDWLDLWALASDELLLALPAVARCDRADCRMRYEQDWDDRHTDKPAVRKRTDNPFAVLSTLKRDD